LKKLVAVLALSLAPAFAYSQQHITSPTEAFGFAPGTDRKLADWVQLTAYYRKLASESGRVKYEEIGKTTEGRPMVALTISSEDNIKHLDEYKKIVSALADPRVTTEAQAKELIARGKTVLVVTANIHSTEIASSQSVTEFAYRLATAQTGDLKAILDNVIVVIVPSQNPDGQQLVVDWYKKYMGTPYEGSNPVVIYHKYVGHDDNRDWATFTQIETQLTTTKVINPWHPQILYDIHQMGSNGPRIYLPPWVDPIDPNVDPLLVSEMNALGSNAATEIMQTGKKGVLIHGVYDFWSPLRDYIALHNGLRILTESASVNIATPINIPFDRLDKGIGYDAKVATWNFPDPWMGGRWTLGDIVSYQIDAFFSIAHDAAVHRERYLSDYYKIGTHAVHPDAKKTPYAYVIAAGAEQRDPVAAARLVNVLRTAANEVEQATADFDAGGKHFAKGSYVVKLAQPYGNFAKTVLERQEYPNIAEYPGGPLQRPYDVTAHTLPLLFGVKAEAIAEPFTVPLTEVVTPATVAGAFKADAKAAGYLIADHSNTSLYALFALLKDGVKAYRLTGARNEPGTIYLPRQAGLAAKLAAVEGKFPVEVTPVATAPAGTALAVKLPRIALYQSWVASMDEGWTRWIFDQNDIPYTRVVDADIRKGDLNAKFDVVVIPDNSARAITTGQGGYGEGGGRGGPQTPPEYKGGLGPAGVAALQTFAEGGGTIVTLNNASQVYVKKGSPVESALEDVTNKDFYIPGSILEATVDTSNPIAFGSTPTVPVFYELSPTFKVSGPAKSVAGYTKDNPLLSGWILGGKYLNGNSALVEEPMGKGRVILFGFRPQYRAMSEVTYKFFFNAMLYASSTAVTLP
jgi:hypothetical protein